MDSNYYLKTFLSFLQVDKSEKRKVRILNLSLVSLTKTTLTKTPKVIKQICPFFFEAPRCDPCSKSKEYRK